MKKLSEHPTFRLRNLFLPDVLNVWHIFGIGFTSGQWKEFD